MKLLIDRESENDRVVIDSSENQWCEGERVLPMDARQTEIVTVWYTF